MKRTVLILLALSAVIYLTGCGKKKAAIEEFQEPLPTTSELAATQPVTEAPAAATGNQATATVQVEAVEVAPAVTAQASLEPLPPAGPYKPASEEIQTALKNAGYYAGKVDGKIGPQSKKAIEEFQKAKGLKADGKVGPKTWAALSSYLSKPETPAPAAVVTSAPTEKKKAR